VKDYNKQIKEIKQNKKRKRQIKEPCNIPPPQFFMGFGGLACRHMKSSKEKEGKRRRLASQ
jgi:hypothetical protein